MIKTRAPAVRDFKEAVTFSLRLIVDYRRKFLDSLVRGGEEEAKQAETQFEQAKAQTDNTSFASLANRSPACWTNWGRRERTCWKGKAPNWRGRRTGWP